MANERLRALEEVEKEIAMVLQCAGEDKLHCTANLLLLYARFFKITLTLLQCIAFTFVLRHLPICIPVIVGSVATGNIVLELSKDKHNASLLDRQLVQFQSSVNRVESELSGQIRYLTQVKDLKLFSSPTVLKEQTKVSLRHLTVIVVSVHR